MKRSLLAIGGCLLLLAGCNEENITLTTNTGGNTVNFTDSSYVITYPSTIPQADSHNVLIEDFSGQSCSNCPSARPILESIVSNHPGRVNVVSLYINYFPQTTPPTGHIYDFRDPVATEIGGLYGNIAFMPGAGIDRIPQNNGIPQEFYKTDWALAVDNQLIIPDSLNLSVSSILNADSTIATITTTVTFTQAVSTPQDLSIVMVEDSMVDIQEDNGSPSGYDSFYVFTDVFRGMITVTNVPIGDPILGNLATKPRGQVDKRVYSYAIPSKVPRINPAHCRIIAFVTYPNGGAVLQSAQCPITH